MKSTASTPRQLRLAATLTVGAALVTGGLALARDGNLGNVDAVLDRLEQRLLDQEADGLTFGERAGATKGKDETEAPSARYRFDTKGQVNATTGEREQMRSIANALTELETQVDQLASNVQKTKQSILDEASIDNFVAIEAALEDTDKASIKTLNIKLDGYPVYELNEASGLWLPSKAVPLYAGPLQPGSHRLDLEARVIMRHQSTESALPMNGDVYRFINKSFDLNIPGGSSKARYVITIQPPANLEETADAVMKEVN